MGILTSKKATPVVAPTPSIADQLFAAADKRSDDESNNRAHAEALRLDAVRAEERADVAANEAKALSEALAILDKAGVTL